MTRFVNRSFSLREAVLSKQIHEKLERDVMDFEKILEMFNLRAVDGFDPGTIPIEDVMLAIVECFSEVAKAQSEEIADMAIQGVTDIFRRGGTNVPLPE